MPRLTLAEIEEKLGPPDELLHTSNNVTLIRQWAILKGEASVQVHAMNNVALINLYHTKYYENEPTLEQTIAAEMLVKFYEDYKIRSIDRELVQRVIKEEIAKLPSKKIEIITPQRSTIIEGTFHYRTELIIKIVSIGHPVMMVGPAGCGKTSIGEHVSKALELPFYVTSTINDTHELTGFIDGYGKYHDTPFRQAFQNGGVWVADEIDAWDASALLAANSALANGFTTFPDSALPVNKHPNFRMIATANTFGNGADRVYVGRNELDAASLDRFATVDVGYDLTLERMFSNGNDSWLKYVWRIRKKINEKKIRHVVSSRSIIMGVAALVAGISRKDVEEIYLFKGMSTNDRKKIS